MRKEKGITLIALVITIIVLLILAGITLILVIGENGLIARAQQAGKENDKQAAIEEMNLKIANAQIKNTTINEEKSKLQKLADRLCEDEEIEYVVLESQKSASLEKINVGKSKKIFVKIKKYKYEFEINESLDISKIDGEQNPAVPEEIEVGATIENTSIIKSIETDGLKYNGDYIIKVNNTAEESEVYDANIIIKNGDLTLDGTTQIDGATLSNNIYEFGNANTDVGTATENAKKTIILKVNGNLTINEGITLTSCKSASGYGGPKGFIIYCTGTITNNGTISMTARGAKAVGQNVYLFRNTDGSYEYVPAEGGTGASAKSTGSSGSYWSYSNGLNGTDGLNRETGGGGSGSTSAWSGSAISGKGTNGTSYSGGTGGGGASSGHGGNAVAADGTNNGANGGNGRSTRGTWSDSMKNAGGGAGNPGGNGWDNSDSLQGTQVSDSRKGENGTGGLLVIYSKILNNKLEIISSGSKGGVANNWDHSCSGGSSGGGSINIFYEQLISRGTITANGGEGVTSYTTSGAGGSGSVTVGSIATGTFVKDE